MERDEARGHMALNARLRGRSFMLRAMGSHNKRSGAAGRDGLDSARAGRGGSRRLLGSEGGQEGSVQAWKVLGALSVWMKVPTGYGAEGGVEEVLRGPA